MRRMSAMLVVVLVLAIVPLPAAAVSTSALPIAPTAVTTADLKCVTMVSSTVAFAAGANGTIIKTTDGGETWVKLTTGTTTADFRGIAFWNANTGVAVTYNRAVYKTTNGGTTWSVANADMTTDTGFGSIGLSGVTAIPGSTDGALLFGGTTPGDGFYRSEQVWRSEYNGGVFWGIKPVLAPKTHLTDDGVGGLYLEGEGEMLAVDFVDSTHGWAVGDDMFTNEDTSTVHATSDGGYTWSRQIFSVPLRLTGVSFANTSVGVVVSSAGRIFRTANGGTAWTEASTVPAPLVALTGVGMIDASNGWAVGAGGTLLRTVNGGDVWSAGTSPVALDLAAVAFSGSRGIAVGLGGTIAVTSDGASWHLPGTSGTDTTAPVMTSLISSTHPIEANWYNQASATLAWTASDAVGVTGYSYLADTSASTRPSETSLGSAMTTTVVIPEGVNYFHVIARDAAGNWSAAPSHRAVRVDLTDPTTGNDRVASYTGGIAEITLSPTDSLSQIAKTEWAVTGTASTSGTGVNVVVTGAGSYSLGYASTDNAGNKETTTTVDFTIAGDPPAVVYVPVAGGTRYTTAVETSKLAFPVAGSAPNVVIATGADWPDALGGAALAGQVGGPILLTDPKALPAAVAAEITRLGATKAYILGGTGAVSLPVENAIRALGVTVERLAGGNRYTTANAIARKATELRSTPYDGTLFVSSGANFPDALAASPLAAAKGWPLYLAAATGLTDETLATMEARGSRVIILGGTGAVSQTVENQLRLHFTSVTRLAGDNRYTTGLEIVKFGTGPGGAGLTWHAPALATGTSFPDALAGGVLQGRSGSVLLLTSGSSLTPEVGSAITSNKAAIREIRYLGGTGAVSPAVRASVQALVQ